MTGRENLVMVARLFGHGRAAAADGGATTVLDQLGLTDAGDRLVRSYSGGMRRRLDLGASLVGAPAAAAARRADDRSRPAQPHRAVGRHPGARRRRHRRAADHAVPRGGRPAGRPRRDRRPRAGDRHRHARRAEGPGRARRRRDPRPPRRRPRPRPVALLAPLGADDARRRRAEPAGRRRRSTTAPTGLAEAVRALADAPHRRSTTSACAARPSTRCSSP